MDSEKLHVRVQCLEQKIMQLLAHHKNQKEVILQLQKEHEQLVQKTVNRSEVDTLTKNKEGNRQHWEARIDNYIRNVDRSIAYLESLQ